MRHRHPNSIVVEKLDLKIRGCREQIVSDYEYSKAILFLPWYTEVYVNLPVLKSCLVMSSNVTTAACSARLHVGETHHEHAYISRQKTLLALKK